jgi:hypothetical protein
MEGDEDYYLERIAILCTGIRKALKYLGQSKLSHEQKVHIAKITLLDFLNSDLEKALKGPPYG